jgi:hypothetical protein
MRWDFLVVFLINRERSPYGKQAMLKYHPFYEKNENKDILIHIENRNHIEFLAVLEEEKLYHMFPFSFPFLFSNLILNNT